MLLEGYLFGNKEKVYPRRHSRAVPWANAGVNVAQIQEIFANRYLPEEFRADFPQLYNADGTFIPQEGVDWDFKEQWPLSYSDSYFAGIARLICGFANSRGGIIIFGVHDTKRTGGHNLVPPNLDKLQQALGSLLSEKPSFILKRYGEGSGKIDVLAVEPRPKSSLPIRFSRKIESYSADVIWFREGHEVIAAEPRHLPALYCRASVLKSAEEDVGLNSSLPPSHATVKRFIGRLSTIDSVFQWLLMRDEPRAFLYGKGGSGKTTIAYEIARTLNSHGRDFAIFGNDVLDNVMFVSAKQMSLNTVSGQLEEFVGKEFQNERELYIAILTRGNWTTENIEGYSLDQLKAEIKEFFDVTSNLIVIDDVDTLMTKGVEAGFDFLHGILWRAKRRSKVLYTLRNVPTQSLSNSIEVPGLAPGGEYEEFVSTCATQFKVEVPPKDFVENRLSIVSERRPLVVESIVALRRTSGTYDRALQLFEEHSGENVRKYVFQREWDSLPPDNHSRHLLAIIALNGQPSTFEDLCVLTRYDQGRVNDALSEIQEIFLTVSNIGEETNYRVGALTSAFVLAEAKKLDLYAQLRARVEQFKRNVYPENPILSRLRDRVEGLLEKGVRFGDADLTQQAWAVINDPSISPRIVEDPRYLALQGYVAVEQNPPKLAEARQAFSNSFSMKYEPDFRILKAWFYAERNSGFGIEQCLKIADFVAGGKNYSDREKLYLLSRKASVLYSRAREDRFNTPEKSVLDFEVALRTHLNCHERYRAAGDYESDKAEEFARNTAYSLFDFLIKSSGYDDFFATATKLFEPGASPPDILFPAFEYAFGLLAGGKLTKVDAQRMRNKLLDLRRLMDTEKLWRERIARDATLAAANKALARLAELSRRN